MGESSPHIFVRAELSMRIRLSPAYNRPADRLKRRYEETGKNRGLRRLRIAFLLHSL